MIREAEYDEFDSLKIIFGHVYYYCEKDKLDSMKRFDFGKASEGFHSFRYDERGLLKENYYHNRFLHYPKIVNSYEYR